MVTTIVTTKGQIVIPSKVRSRLHITKGTRLCVIDDNGQIILRPLTREYFSKVAGILRSKKSLVQELLSERGKDKEKEDAGCKK